MKLKKFLAMALVLCMLVSIVPMTVFAEEVETIAAGETKVVEMTADVERQYTFIPEKDGDYIVLGYVYSGDSIFSIDFNASGPNDFQVDYASRVQIMDAKAGEAYHINAWWGAWDEYMEFVEISVMEGVPLEGLEMSWGDHVVHYLTSESDTEYLDVNTYPENAILGEVVWKSSNEKVATVEDGRVKCLAVGETTITAAIDNISASCKLEVKEMGKLELDKAETLTGTILDESCVERYLFTAKEAGTYVLHGEGIFFDASWGEDENWQNIWGSDRIQMDLAAGEIVDITASFYYWEESDDTRTFMIQKAVPAQSIYMMEDWILIWADDSDSYYVMDVYTEPANAKLEKITWKSDNEAVAKVQDDGVIYPVAPGSCTITVTMGSLSTSITVVVKETLALELNKKASFVAEDTEYGFFTRGFFTAPEDGTYVAHGKDLELNAISMDGNGQFGICRAQFDAKKGETFEIYAYAADAEGEHSFVIEKAAALKSVSLKEYLIEDFVGVGRYGYLYLETDPANAQIGQVKWTSSDESVLKINGADGNMCYLIGVKPGSATITATVDGKTVSKTVTVDLYQPFDDVAVNKYYYEPVLWAVDMGITSGYKDETFRPDKTCTRAEVVTFLWRAAGERKPHSKENPFSDLASDKYYYDSVLWAVENKITSGYKDGTFQPSKTCSRAEVVTFLWRAAGSPKPTTTENPFEDVSADKYYYDAVLWAVENKITTGKTATTFQPSATCTRGQIVTFLYRYLVEGQSPEA